MAMAVNCIQFGWQIHIYSMCLYLARKFQFHALFIALKVVSNVFICQLRSQTEAEAETVNGIQMSNTRKTKLDIQNDCVARIGWNQKCTRANICGE